MPHASAVRHDELGKSLGWRADERWGDAPVHSLATALLLRADEVHFFDQIGYYHEPFSHVPIRKSYRQACHPIKPGTTAIERRSPMCLNNWVRHNWKGQLDLPFSTFLDDLPLHSKLRAARRRAGHVPPENSTPAAQQGTADTPPGPQQQTAAAGERDADDSEGEIKALMKEPEGSSSGIGGGLRWDKAKGWVRGTVDEVHW